MKKIAVLGGGVSAISSVLELTAEQDWQTKYDITLYQLGWRLGGKCASGRNPYIAQRIEEHGLHLWFGFYDNAFKMIQDVYAENNRPQSMPLATWQEALKPYNFAVLEEDAFDWVGWPFDFPTNNEVPGTMAEQPTITEMMHALASAVHHNYSTYNYLIKEANVPPEETHHSLLERIKDSIEGDLQPFIDGVEDLGLKVLESILRELEKLISDIAGTDRNIIVDLIEKLIAYVWKRLEPSVEKNITAQQCWIFLDLGLTIIKGALKDDVIGKGYDVINDVDLKAWLLSQGATNLTAESCVIQALYSLIFAGRDQYTFEAGTALRGAVLLGLHYKGSFYYRMQAGMGDTIFAPVYEVLKKRGVKFKFFHKVNELQLADDKKSVQRIIVGRQATVKEGDYQPLVNVKALPCWPSYPLYDQLQEGGDLRNKNVDLESPWSDWKDIETITLEKGTDFDLVLFGISIGSIPFLCKEMLAVSPQWQDMVKNVVAIPTQALQLWLKPDSSGLGWPYPTTERAIFGTYIEPYDTYADMSDLLPRECWDAQLPPGADPAENNWPAHLAYFCGPLFDIQMEPFSEHDFPDKVMAGTKQIQLDFLNNLAYRFWPDAIDADKKFKWDLLVDYNALKGEDRLNGQYSRININPTELYVLSVVNSTKFRPEPYDPQFENLYITGDWLNTGINAGCVEASVIAGKKTARAISGINSYIKWEQDRVTK